jgi:hypothetical protein
MAFVTKKIIRIAVATATPTFASLIRLCFALNFFSAFLDEPVFFSFLGEFPLSSFDLTRFAIAVSPCCLLGGNAECAATDFAFSQNHFSTPYLPH